ncbi:hypothetical protein AGLY_011853 [Aphis glycines]|uniref:Uncharacterized protein n=1 Tax=Aphis glycines TaxID=307491 RepID=A0A6G0TCQ1_APHGL|nr:hypothetical protein AGLY_011853 [Aphis glycines]
MFEFRYAAFQCENFSLSHSAAFAGAAATAENGTAGRPIEVPSTHYPSYWPAKTHPTFLSPTRSVRVRSVAKPCVNFPYVSVDFVPVFLPTSFLRSRVPVRSALFVVRVVLPPLRVYFTQPSGPIGRVLARACVCACVCVCICCAHANAHNRSSSRRLLVAVVVVAFCSADIFVKQENSNSAVHVF